MRPKNLSKRLILLKEISGCDSRITQRSHFNCGTDGQIWRQFDLLTVFRGLVMLFSLIRQMFKQISAFHENRRCFATPFFSLLSLLKCERDKLQSCWFLNKYSCQIKHDYIMHRNRGPVDIRQEVRARLHVC